MATKQFKCNVCGYIHEGDAAPEKCPVCSAPASEFTALQSDENGKPAKKGFFQDTNSNGYILFYSTVMVVLVAAALAFVSLSLQKRQADNELNEKKVSILKSLFASEATEDKSVDEVIAEKGIKYDEFIESSVLDVNGQKIEGADAFAQLRDLKTSFKEGKFPVFEAKDGRLVIPVNGVGLWGPIWGYVALGDDMNTIQGIIMDHKGETPGLGAEIATAKYQARFVGKEIFEGDKFVSIVLRKGGAQDPLHEVDAITGGTKTSDGVSQMLHASLEHYLPLLNARRQASAQNEQVSNEEIVENHE